MRSSVDARPMGSISSSQMSCEDLSHFQVRFDREGYFTQGISSPVNRRGKGIHTVVVHTHECAGNAQITRESPQNKRGNSSKHSWLSHAHTTLIRW